jgi:DNA-binding transcriptional LysR family regulator
VPADTATLVHRELRPRNVELVVTPTMTLREERDLDVETLFEDRFVVMAGAESRLVHRRKLTLVNLLDERWILPPADSLPGASIAQTFRAADLKVPSTQMVSFSLPLHHHLLATGRFVTMLPASMLRFGKHLPLKLLSVEMTEIPYPTGIVTLQNRTLSPMAQVFIDSARKIAAMMVKTR